MKTIILTNIKLITIYYFETLNNMVYKPAEDHEQDIKLTTYNN